MRLSPLILICVLLLSACGPATTAVAPTAPPAPTAAPAAAPTTPAAAAPAATAPASPKSGGILKVGLQADPTSLDPQKTNLTAAFHITEQIYSRVVRLKPDLTVEPDLAEKWDVSADGKTYTFTLRKGVKFHSGRALTSADVKYTLERLQDKATASPNASLMASVDNIAAPDDGTVVITLKQADSSFLTNLTASATAIVNRDMVQQYGDLSQHADGSGPFKFKEYVPNTRVVLEKNPDYWETGKPYVDGIEMTIAPDDTARTAALRSGTVDFIEYAPLKDIATMKSDNSILLAGDQNTNIRYIGLNVTRKPFSDVKVRQAVAAAIDRDAVLGPAVSGYGIPALELFPAGYWAAPGAKPSAPDIARAKQLLTEAGYPNGFNTTILSWSQYSFLSNAAVVVQDQLKQIGINADMNLEENAAFLKDYLGNNFDMTVTGVSGYVDPNDVYYRNFGTDQPSNAVHYSNPKVDDLIAQGIATTDQAKRKDIYAQLQQVLLDDAPWVNLYIAQQFEAMKTYVKGYTHIPTGTNTSFKDVWLDK
jgi:peptide/nickel transport system substrate-binding protein